MFYRRKILLSLLELFDGQLDKIRLQKLLFLMSQRQARPEYEFIPYRFGCYSYSANADLYAMTQKGLLDEDEKNFTKKDPVNYISLLKPGDRLLLTQIKTNYGAMDARSLMKHTYVNFPFYAIKSEVAHQILNKQELLKVEDSRPQNTQTILFTIGYEGISLEQYLLRLLKNDVKVLVDVRNNPLSMKYGFSKSLLRKFCNSIGIEYMHFPEVGIRSDKRQALNIQADYDRLFAQYRQDNLPYTKDSQSRILDLLIDKKRIALTCFEANICQCHRKHLAEAIEKLPGFKYKVKHI